MRVASAVTDPGDQRSGANCLTPETQQEHASETHRKQYPCARDVHEARSGLLTIPGVSCKERHVFLMGTEITCLPSES